MKANPQNTLLTVEKGNFIIQDILLGTKKLDDNIRTDMDSLLRKSSNDIFKGVVTFWVLIAVTIIVSILIFFQSIGMITAPLRKISEVSNSIADGDLNVELPDEKREDEIGQLVGSYKRMIQSLRDVSAFAAHIASGDLSKNLTPRSANDEMIDSLNKMSTALRGIIGGTQEGTRVLSSTSSQIFSGTAQLATSSNQTATAITETTATIEEVKKTSEISSRKSREVSVVAQQATEISERGMMATENTIDGIHRIGGQMKTIGLSIDRLTEQSKAIGEIIATVNDLAEQSNLLAVNASIEAARAGEQGKIFVVVAQEIKSLSEQSKQATAQVKTVLNDVQSAIQASVIATGEGEKIVSEAVQLSSEAQKAIAKLAETINVFNDAALQTSVASQEQFVGMDQVAIAMENIKSASIQNVRTTKELEGAAKSLLSLAEKLSDMNAVFTVK
jgi:methyl-accepting chemotaxis protein